MLNIQKLIQKCKIEDVISRYTQLEYKNENNLKACCPFHHEKTPSFLVEIVEKYFICFGCGKKGNVINFVSEIEGISFEAAYNLLAIEHGLKVNTTHLQLLNEVNDYYKENILKSSSYLLSRKIYRDQWEHWELGYSGETFDLSNEFKLYTSELEELGLLNVKNKGTISEFYPAVLSNRITFPIFNHKTPVAFGGRTVSNDSIKYFNTKDNQFYSKMNSFYGLNHAQKSIKEKDQAIIVEGYIDVIRAHEHSYENTISSMGTSLTQIHVQKLKNLTKNVLLFFDRDLSGEEAIKRSCKFLIAYGFENIEIGLLPEGEDPDSFLLQKKKLEDAEIFPIKSLIKELYSKEEFLSIIKLSKDPFSINQDLLNLYKINIETLFKKDHQNLFNSERYVKINKYVQLSLFLDVFPDYYEFINEDEIDLLEEAKNDPVFIRLKINNFYKKIKQPNDVFNKLRK